MSDKRIKNVIVQFWIAPQTDETVRKIALAENRSVSSVYRELVEKGLVAAGYRAGDKDIASLVRSSVNEVLKPHVERLASICAKGVQIDAASYFLQVYNGKQALPDYRQDDYDEIATQARKLGIEYLKLPREKSIDEFIGRGLKRLGDDDP